MTTLNYSFVIVYYGLLLTTVSSSSSSGLLCLEVALITEEWIRISPNQDEIKFQETFDNAGRFEPNNSTCPLSYKLTEAIDFRIFPNNSIWIPADSNQNLVWIENNKSLNKIAPLPDVILNPGDYCVVNDTKYVVRYCAADPCASSVCVFKCCPLDQVVNLTAKSCQNALSTIPEVDFRNQTGHQTDQSPSSYIIWHGMKPRCDPASPRVTVLNPQDKKEDEFFILPDGRMYVPSFSEELSDYCVAELAEDHSQQMAFHCSSEINEEVPKDVAAMLGVFPYLMMVSAAFLIATLAVYAALPELRNVHGVTVMCYVASLTILYVGMAFIQLNLSWMAESDSNCIGFAIVTHFAFLAAFAWLNVMCFDIWLTFRKPMSVSRKSSKGWQQVVQLGWRFVFYSLYGWGVPLVIVIVGQALDSNAKRMPSHIVRPRFGKIKCWFDSKGALAAYVYGPIGVMIAANLAFFVSIAAILYRSSIDAAAIGKSKHSKQRLHLIVYLFVLMGVLWTAEVISFAAEGSAYASLPTDVINILTGVFVFAFFVLLKPNVRRQLAAAFISCCPRLMTTRLGRFATSRWQSSYSSNHGVSVKQSRGRATMTSSTAVSTC